MLGISSAALEQLSSTRIVEGSKLGAPDEPWLSLWILEDLRCASLSGTQDDSVADSAEEVTGTCVLLVAVGEHDEVPMTSGAEIRDVHCCRRMIEEDILRVSDRCESNPILPSIAAATTTVTRL